MNLLMWRTGLVPYSSASLWIIVRLQWLPRARRHICSPSKSQTERKMSCEYKSISRLFQVFISQSLCFLSLACSWSSSRVTPLHLPFHLPSHTHYNYFLPLLLCPPDFFLPFSLLISHHANYPFILLPLSPVQEKKREASMEKVGVCRTDRRLNSWQGEGQLRVRSWYSLVAAAGINVLIILTSIIRYDIAVQHNDRSRAWAG